MRYNGVYTAQMALSSIAGAATLIELQLAAGTQIDILRAWVSAADNLIDDVIEVRIYGNDAVATGTGGATEQEIQGTSDATSGVTAVQDGTVGATPVALYIDVFHLQQGWLYLPVEEERIRIVGGTAIDNVGIQFPVAPGASVDVVAGITWGELG